jgi:hypothetical protein
LLAALIYTLKKLSPAIARLASLNGKLPKLVARHAKEIVT